MLGIIQSKITSILRIYFATLVMFYPILMLSRSFFPNSGQGPFPKIAGKGPALNEDPLTGEKTNGPSNSVPLNFNLGP